MRTLLNALVIPALACLPMLVHAENPAAGAIIMNTITPNEAAPGVVATIKGENLDAQHIKLVYLFNLQPRLLKQVKMLRNILLHLHHAS